MDVVLGVLESYDPGGFHTHRERRDALVRDPLQG